MPIWTDLPSFAIETSRKMFSLAGKVPFDGDPLADAVGRDQRRRSGRAAAAWASAAPASSCPGRARRAGGLAA